MYNTARFLALFFVFILFVTHDASAQDTTPVHNSAHNNDSTIRLDTSLFGQIPILHEGRIKPLDSFARANLKTLSGKETAAMPWLIELLLDPARAEKRPAIKVTNPEIRSLLHIAKRKSRLYSYQELSKAMISKQEMIQSIAMMNEEDWTPQQRDLVVLQENLGLFQNLLSSLTLFLPLSSSLPDTLPEELQFLSVDNLTYIDIAEKRSTLNEHVKSIIANKGDKIEDYTEEEQALAHLSFTLSVLEETSKGGALFKVLQESEREWLAPWEFAHQGRKNTPMAYQYWRNLVMAYHDSDAKSWHKNITLLYESALHENDGIRIDALSAEYHYNQFNPFFISFMLCLSALGLLFITLFHKKLGYVNFAASLMLSSLIVQSVGIALRIYILERAPVSTLYETILFVCCLMALYMLIAFYRNKQALWLWLGCILSIFLHILGFSHNQDGDSFVVLSAVLNTNFWLTTHVLCITAGYAFCAITSILAHYALISMAIKKQKTPEQTLFKNIHSAALLALFFAGIGTVLGGIWADQSWGRFWGWDPKENGALLIVLWLIWVLHGRISGQLKHQGTLYGLCFLSVILALSWFGVNLLGVGLHAYGFTDSATWSLGLFTIVEIAFILVIAAIRKSQQAKECHV